MKLTKDQIHDFNQNATADQAENFGFLKLALDKKGTDADEIVSKLADFQVAIPSWALGSGGTRFGRFSIGGEPTNLEQKLDDIGLLHALTQTAGAVSLHIPWDVPSDAAGIKQRADSHGIVFDAMNSNTFQDQSDQKNSYKYGSLADRQAAVREQAVAHNAEVIRYGKMLDSKSLTVWLADGASFPGQNNFRQSLQNTQRSLQEIYAELPDDWRMFIEYKPYEPSFYSDRHSGLGHLTATGRGLWRKGVLPGRFRPPFAKH